MSKLVILSLVLLCTAVQAFCQTNTVLLNKLKAAEIVEKKRREQIKVSGIKELYTYFDDGNHPLYNPYLTGLSEFDINGYLITHYYYGRKLKYTYEYDSLYMKQVKTVYHTENNQIAGKYTYHYFKYRFNPIEMINFDEDNKPYRREVYTYDDQGYEVKMIRYDQDEKITTRFLSKYNEAKTSMELRIYDENDFLFRYDLYTFDDVGRRIKWVDYDSGGKEINSVAIYTYNELGLLISESNTETYGYQKKKRETITQYNYDVEGRKIGWKIIFNGKLRSRFELELDSLGNRTRLIKYIEDKINFIEYERSYDESGRELSYTGFDENDPFIYKTTNEYDKLGNIIQSIKYQFINENTAQGTIITGNPKTPLSVKRTRYKYVFY